jgi:hypothetical protein
MPHEITCPRCDTGGEAEEWDNGECPKCKLDYWWEEFCAEDYSDCWSYVEWDQK